MAKVEKSYFLKTFILVMECLKKIANNLGDIMVGRFHIREEVGAYNDGENQVKLDKSIYMGISLEFGEASIICRTKKIKI